MNLPIFLDTCALCFPIYRLHPVTSMYVYVVWSLLQWMGTLNAASLLAMICIMYGWILIGGFVASTILIIIGLRDRWRSSRFCGVVGYSSGGGLVIVISVVPWRLIVSTGACYYSWMVTHKSAKRSSSSSSGSVIFLVTEIARGV